jgi:hypothetical protein
MSGSLRLGPDTVSIDVFRAFVAANGAVEEPPRAASAEILRFKVGRALGYVSKKDNGTLTFAGIARPMVEQWMAEDRAARIAAKGEAA